ncbi:MAG: N-acetylmuramoyl-L-alanine amidase [Moraxellaceae bacterium]|nr:MAG: N-acetylmuramoyl-L-alanine amidase [Moraxellaceae bacterium]
MSSAARVIGLGVILLIVSTLTYADEKVSNVRVWQAPDSTRVVFDLSGPVVHSIFTLTKPSRVVIDLKNTLRTKALFNIDLKDSAILKVRSAMQNKKDLRIVLDLKSALRPKSFLLKPNAQYGHRLVLDLEGSVASTVSTKASRSTAVNTATPIRKPKTKVAGGRDIVVAIDAGHGGEDPGATGQKGTREKHVVLKIAKELKAALNKYKGIRAELTRKGDYFLKLKTRREIARKKLKADIFISIHADAFKNGKASGASVFALSRSGATSTLARVLAEQENKSDVIGGVNLEDKDEVLASVLADLAMEGSMDHSLTVGKYVLSEMGRVTKLHKKRIEQAGFAVLKSPDMPSILIETGFISNATEEKNLNSLRHRKKLTQAMAKGVLKYFEQHPPPGSKIALRKAKAAQFAHHTIRRGETLSKIANRYRVSLASLRQANSMSQKDILKIGRTLLIPQS